MSTQHKSKTILLVEDDIFTAMAETSQLKKYGYNVIQANTGQEAIEIVFTKKAEIELILMDINLGNDIDGCDTAKIILKNQDIPIIFFSNHEEQNIVQKTNNITSYGYILKGSNITVLDASIKMALKLFDADQKLKYQKKEVEKKEMELQFLEKRYRRLFETAKDGILILDGNNGMIMDVNPFLMDMLGYSKEQFLKKNIWDISAFKNVDYSKKLYKELQSKKYVRYDDLPLETSDNNPVHVEFISNVYNVDKEKVIQCNIRDITVRKKHEKKLTDNIEEKDNLLKEIHHRTKNSFLMILSLISIRADSVSSKETKNTLEDLVLRVKSISDLYSLLYETGSYTVVKLKPYCNRVIDSMRNLSESIKINQSIDSMTVSTKNASMIGMILVELLSNTLKHAFTKEQYGTLNIELKKIQSKIILSVEDNGKGFPDGFDISYSKTLGLQLVNSMVHQHKGNIQYITDNGAKVIIELFL